MAQLGHAAAQGVVRLDRETAQETLRVAVRLSLLHAQFRVQLVCGPPLRVEAPASVETELPHNVPHFHRTHCVALSHAECRQEIHPNNSAPELSHGIRISRVIRVFSFVLLGLSKRVNENIHRKTKRALLLGVAAWPYA